MPQTLRDIIKYLEQSPRTLFMIDSLGALLTTFFLFAILRNFNEYFGIPETTLNLLSIIAASLCMYSTTCFFFLKDNWAPFIRAIGFANLLYCILTMRLVIFIFPSLKIMGIAYFLVEMIIVCGLVYIELNVATAIKKKRTVNSLNP